METRAVSSAGFPFFMIYHQTDAISLDNMYN